MNPTTSTNGNVEVPRPRNESATNVETNRYQQNIQALNILWEIVNPNRMLTVEHGHENPDAYNPTQVEPGKIYQETTYVSPEVATGVAPDIQAILDQAAQHRGENIGA